MSKDNMLAEELITKTLEHIFQAHDLPMPSFPLEKEDQLVRIGTLLDQAKRGEKKRDILYEWDDIVFHPDENILVKKGHTIKLTEKETALMTLLAQANGQSISREHLMNDIWGYAPEAETHTLETHMYRLRQKIEDDPSNPTIVITEEEGYRLGRV